MPKPRTKTGEKNLISRQLVELRKQHNYSQRYLSYLLQPAGYDMDKNVVTRIETNQRYVTDLELQALSQIFHVSYDYLIDMEKTGKKTHESGTYRSGSFFLCSFLSSFFDVAPGRIFSLG